MTSLGAAIHTLTCRPEAQELVSIGEGLLKITGSPGRSRLKLVPINVLEDKVAGMIFSIISHYYVSFFLLFVEFDHTIFVSW